MVKVLHLPFQDQENLAVEIALVENNLTGGESLFFDLKTQLVDVFGREDLSEQFAGSDKLFIELDFVELLKFQIEVLKLNLLQLFLLDCDLVVELEILADLQGQNRLNALLLQVGVDQDDLVAQLNVLVPHFLKNRPDLADRVPKQQT